MFRQAWEYYVTATELSKKSKKVQAGALCSVMGLECVKVMNSLTAPAPEDKSDPEKILTASGNHFMPQKHLLFERVKFGFANQTEHEPIDQYVVRLRQLAESCKFEGLCESLIRKTPSVQQTNRILEIKSNINVIGDMNESKVNKKKQMQGNASSVAPIILTIELNVQRLVRLALNVANKDTLPSSVRKRIESRVGQPTRYIT